MRKAEGLRWEALEGEGKPHEVKPAKTDSNDSTGAKGAVSNYPTSSTKGPKNWEKMAKDVKNLRGEIFL